MNKVPGLNHKGGYERSINLIGKRFGRLVVVEKYKPFRKKDGSIQCAGWLCKCDCGNEVVVRSNSLRMGKTKSCGCLNKEKGPNHVSHGMTNTIIYWKYHGMKARCYNKNSTSYKHYGGRGIKICQEWLDDFMNFYNWAMENGYNDNLTIERKDVDGDYCPENCCWIPYREQAYNKTNTIRTESGESIAKIAKEFGIVSPQVAVARYESGWNLRDSVSIGLLKEGETLEKIKKFKE